MSLSRFEDRLLRAGRTDSPSAHQKSAARAAVMGAAFGATMVTATTASAAKGATVAAKGLGMLKLLAVVTLGVGAAISYQAVTPTTVPIVMTQPSEHVFVRATRPSAPAVRPVVIPAISIDSLPTAAPLVAVAAPAPDVAEETRLLAAARDCNASGDWTCSGSQLAEYRRRFPRGQLIDEAELVAIDRLRRMGDTAEAKRRLASFLARQPNHPFARQIEKRLSEVP